MKNNYRIQVPRRIAGSILLGAFLCMCASGATAPTGPPVAPIRQVEDLYFGVKVSDPYRYMEDPSNPEVAAWFKDQNAYTHAVLSTIPGRASLLRRIQQLDDSGLNIKAVTAPLEVLKSRYKSYWRISGAFSSGSSAFPAINPQRRACPPSTLKCGRKARHVPSRRVRRSPSSSRDLGALLQPHGRCPVNTAWSAPIRFPFDGCP